MPTTSAPLELRTQAQASLTMPDRPRYSEPYRSRKLSPAERQAEVEERRRRGWPWHGPPHFSEGEAWYMISAANFEHRHIMHNDDRRLYMQHRLLEDVEAVGGSVQAWAVMPNHYHLLALVPDIEAFGQVSKDLHRGTATEWNRMDKTRGRQVWYRYSDRKIRGERHYFASFSYIHGNPQKHGFVERADQWSCSSLSLYIKQLGHEYLRELWRRYPPLNMGKGWDDF